MELYAQVISTNTITHSMFAYMSVEDRQELTLKHREFTQLVLTKFEKIWKERNDKCQNGTLSG